VQPPEESWRECHLHARNVLGNKRYKGLLEEIDARKRGAAPRRAAEPPAAYGDKGSQGSLF